MVRCIEIQKELSPFCTWHWPHVRIGTGLMRTINLKLDCQNMHRLKQVSETPEWPISETEQVNCNFNLFCCQLLNPFSCFVCSGLANTFAPV